MHISCTSLQHRHDGHRTRYTCAKLARAGTLNVLFFYWLILEALLVCLERSEVTVLFLLTYNRAM